MGHSDPCGAAIAICEKFGSLRNTAATLVCVVLCCFGALTAVAAFSGWKALFLVPAYIGISCLACLLLGDLATDCAPPKDRAPVCTNVSASRRLDSVQQNVPGLLQAPCSVKSTCKAVRFAGGVAPAGCHALVCLQHHQHQYSTMASNV